MSNDIDELIAGLVKDARNIAAGDLGAGDRKDALTNINSAITALQEGQQRIAELEKLTNNFVNLMTSDCEKHTGENTPPFDVFIRDYCGCAVCRVEENKRLDAALSDIENLDINMSIVQKIIDKARAGDL